MSDRPLPLPENGKYKISDWATIFDVTEETIKDHVNKQKIPTIRLGNIHVVDATVWWNQLEVQLKGNNE